MKLWVHELSTELSQDFTAADDIDVAYIRPHLLKYGSPTGTLKLEIRGANGDVIYSGATIDISTISAENYFHGFVRFAVNQSFRSGDTFKVVLVAGGGYSFSELAYIGWCNGFDLAVNEASYSNPNGKYAALNAEFWAYDEVKRGIYK